MLYLCDRQGLIGREMFAIDGVKLPSNASKARSGTLEDFVREAARLESAVGKMLERHHHNDGQSVEPASATERKAERLKEEAADIRRWLHSNPQDRPGARGAIRQSNRTDIESAKMATSKGVIQGYCGVAAVDARHQIIVEAQAHGSGSEQELLLPVIDAIRPLLTQHSTVTADAGYHSEANLQALEAHGLEALIADNAMRARDERFADQHRHKLKPDPLSNKSEPQKKPAQYGVEDFHYDAKAQTCRCPNGKMLYRTGSHIRIKGYVGTKSAVRCAIECPVR